MLLINKILKKIVYLFFTYILLLNTMIAISLTVILEIVKVILVDFIKFDIEFFNFIRQNVCETNSIRIIEELGKVNYNLVKKQLY